MPIGAPPTPGSTNLKRLLVRWALLLAFVVGLGVAFVNLGHWQLDRLAQRKENNAVVEGHEKSAAVPFETVFNAPITDSDQWQRVTVTGTFDASHQFQVRYRTNADKQGFEVITPLRSTAGPVVLVDRGLVQVFPGQQIPDVLPPAPTGKVTVVGYVRRSEQGSTEAITPVDGRIRLINTPAIAAVLPYPIVDGYVSAISVQPPQPPELIPLQPPALNEGPHFWYAVQWFVFTGLAALGFVVFVRGDLRDRRAAQAAKAGARTPGQEVTHSEERDGSRIGG